MIELPDGNYIAQSAIILIKVDKDILEIQTLTFTLKYSCDDNKNACAWRKKTS